MTRLILLLLMLTAVASAAQSQTLKRIQVNGVELHYIEAGTGDPVILLHGGTGDYRSLPGPFQTLSRHYHVISYSRRYHYPNHNPVQNDHSALVEADDLAALIQALKLGPVHLVGTSYGALTALELAVKHPGMVRSMFLTEPPIHSWMEGTEHYREFMVNIWDPARAAFKRGDKRAGMRAFVNGLFGPGYFDRLPPAAAAAMMDNAPALQALALSSDPFPNLSKVLLGGLLTPTLIMTGANTIALHKDVDEELARHFINVKAVTVPNAGHGIARDNPEMFMSTLLEFLRNPPASVIADPVLFAPPDRNSQPKPANVQKLLLLSKPEAEYTEEARRNGIIGTVVLQVLFLPSGEINVLRVISGLPYGLTEKAIEAAKKIKFRPQMIDGRAVEKQLKVEYNFNQ
jgi:TonB family protein